MDYFFFVLPPEGLDYRDVEKSLVIQALEYTGYNQFRASKLLKMTRDQIRYRIQKYGIKK